MATDPKDPFPPNTLFRVRAGWFGKSVLQKFDGDMSGKGPLPGFRDVPWSENMGGFTIVRREALAKLVERVAAAEKRAKLQREHRQKRKDFEASQLESRLPEDPPP